MSAAENHNAFVRQLQGIYQTNGRADPFLANMFNKMIFVSWVASWSTPMKSATTDASTKEDGK